MTALQVQMKKPLTRTRLIGFAAMGVCALGYTGMVWPCWRASWIIWT